MKEIQRTKDNAAMSIAQVYKFPTQEHKSMLSLQLVTTQKCLIVSLLLLYLVDCKWNEFSEWSACSKSCGGGQSSRQRTVLSKEAHGGVACSGLAKEILNCNLHPCPGERWTSYIFYY